MKKWIYPALWCAFTCCCLQARAGLSPKFRIYFNQAVNTSVSSGTNAISVGANMMDTLINYINMAQSNIDIAQYEYSGYTNLATAINNAYARGVTIRYIYDESGTNTSLSSLNASIPTVGRPTNSNSYIMHDKFVLIDANASDSTQSWVYTGSMDWNTTQVTSDYNNIIIIQSQQLAKAYTAQFNQMWGGSGPQPVAANEKFGSAKTSLGPHIFTIDGIEVELYFSPTDSTNNHIIDMLHSANSQLFFGVYTFTEAPNADTINAKYNAGVYTFGIVDQYSEGYAAYTAMSPVLGNNLKVYAQSSSIYHNKYAIADACNTNSDPQVLTGSHNWTAGANTGNDENTLIIHDPTIANIYYQAFSSDFSSLGGTITGCTVNVSCNNAITTTTQVNSNVLCYGGSTGEATVHAHGSGTPFTYAWSTGGQTDSTLSNVAAGTYIVTVTDHNSCSVTASVTITQPSAALTVTAAPTAAGCSGPGSISTTVSGGTSGYSYTWNTAPTQTTATATNLTAGTYKVTVTDANGCSATASATVGSSSGITLGSPTITEVSCFGGDNGSITVSPSGGSGYSYVWNTSPQQTTVTASNLAAGSYSVTVTDASNCSASATYTITQPSSGITLSTSTTSATCGSNNGSASVTVTSGGSGFTYHWSTGASTASISGLGANSYNVTVTGTGGCTATAVAVVSSTGGPSITASATATTCGLSNGSALVTVTSGTGSYTYAWSNGGNSTSISGLSSGVYSVTVTQSGCPAVATVTVGASSAPTLSMSSANASCGSNNGTAAVSVTGGTTPYSYSWSNSGTSSSISGLSAGSYSVTVTDNAGCSVTGSVSVGSSGSSSGGSVSITTNKSFICQYDSAHICATQGFSSYQWSNGGTGECITVGQAGYYDVTVTSNGNCSAVSGQLQIQVYSPTTVNITANGNTLTCTTLATYQWYLNGQAITGATSNTWVAVQTGNYSVSGTDLNGCPATSAARYVVISGIGDLSEENIKIYPNPTNSTWQLEMPAAWTGAQYELYDLGGNEVAAGEIRTAVTTLSIAAAQGVYFIKISTGQQNIVRKVVKL